MTRPVEGSLPALPAAARDPFATVWPPPADVRPPSSWAASGGPAWRSSPAPVGWPAGPAAPDGAPLAGLGARLGARILDFFVTYLITMLVWVPFFMPSAGEFRQLRTLLQGYLDAARAQDLAGEQQQLQALLNDGTLQHLSVTVTLVNLSVTCVYMVGFLFWKGATPGKMAAGVRVRPVLHDGRLTLGQCFRRWLAREGVAWVPVLFIGPLYWLVDSLSPLWDRRRQAFHDKAARTVVVRARN